MSPSSSDPLPRVGFISLGCSKATVDSEQILTRLAREGYEISGSSSYEDVDLVIINTCGFIDAAIEESLDAIGEALAGNGKVIVTGCLGARARFVREAYPQVLDVLGPHATEAVMRAVHCHLPMPGATDTDPVPQEGVH
ncbi:MAG: 30S ribosomal protein S12 methylthiotransferase RimO, partial [Azoarcus sp.]|nr:30S ribosomal protein S12 methylthiotransferase RimO [Azoarcus sp.]